jgi:NADH:ubiquinone oxidoreductase subunit K
MTGAVLASAFIALGLYGVLTRRELIAVLASVEVMLGGATLLLVVLASSMQRTTAAAAVLVSGEAVALILLAVVAAEAAVGLSLLVALVARGHSRTDEIAEVRG